MRLINAKTLLLHEFYGTNIPPYVILSHTWGDDEVTFKDWEDISQATKKAGFAKIRGACSKALDHTIDWVWVDTNCIDKTSSAELTEAINSMFDWYARAEICYAYLSDIPSANAPVEEISRSRWFTRGWTLQELLAPKKVTFYAADWSRLGSKAASLAGVISEATGIHRYFLTGATPVRRACIAEKMSWLSKRTTTRTEDIAYCMLGLFEINMPLLYGEGAKAFIRLQHEIIRSSNDHTIFCWIWDNTVPKGWMSFLAPSPAQFSGSGVYTPARIIAPTEFADREVSTYSMTNAGLSIRLPVIYTLRAYFVVFEASPKGHHGDRTMLTCFQVCGYRRGGVLHVMRAPFPRNPVFIRQMSRVRLTMKTIIVMNRFDGAVEAMGWRATMSTWESNAMSERVEGPGHLKIPGIILAFDSRDVKKRWGILKRSHAVIDNYFGVIKFDLTGSHSMPQVGVVLIHMVAEDGNRMCIAVGVKVDRHTVRPKWYSQLFHVSRSAPLGAREDARAVERLKEQISRAEEGQTTHYCKSLGLSVSMDVLHPTPREQDTILLRISEGEMSDGYFTSPSHGESSDPVDDSSMVKAVPFATKGILQLPGTYDMWWRELYMQGRGVNALLAVKCCVLAVVIAAALRLRAS